jgi:cell division protein FtsL
MGENVEQEILQRLTRVETKLDLMASARDTANEALQLVKAAEIRIARIEKVVYWTATTIIGALLVGAVSLLFKFKGA